MFTTIEEEKRFNPRLSSTTEAQFVEIMNNLKLPYPKKIDAALPSNKVDGMLGHQ
jgi:sulfur dioxygenase